MSDPEENVKARIQPKIRAAVETVARERRPNGFRVDKDDFERLMEVITIERIRSNENCSSSMSLHAHRVDLSVQADLQIRVYPMSPVKKGAAIGGGAGAVVGAAGGTAGGIAAGAVIGSVVPVAGTIVGGIIGGVVGFFGGLAAGGSVGAGAGAGIGAADSNNRHTIICASEVFVKFEEYSTGKNHNTCHCVLTAPTQCPSGDEGPDNEKKE